ncbi:MAG: DUF1552 domain-containing protein [Myxococcota bacterium]
MTKGLDLLVRRTSRRSFLVGAGGVAVALPFLATLAAPRRATAWAPLINGPKRLIVMYHHHGLVMDEWWPKADGSYGQVLAPIAAAGLQSKTLVLGGVDHKVTGGHWGNAWTALTCRRETHWGDANWQITGAGPSVDHVIGQLIADGGAPRRLDLRVPDDPGTDVSTSQLFWAGAGDPINQQNRPQKVFDALFGTAPPPPDAPTVDVLAVRRKSVLDGVLEQFNRLRSRVALEDRQRLDVHADKIRTIETTLAHEPVDPASLPASCGSAPIISGVSTYDFERYAEAHASLLVHAIACGQADVGTLSFSEPSADKLAFLNEPTLNTTFERGGANYHGAWHLYSDQGERGDTAKTFTAIGAWKAKIFTRLMKGLQDIDEGNGRTALDNTMLVWLGEFGNGGGHAAGNQTLTIGGNFGNVALGRHLSLAPDTANPTLSWGFADRPGFHQLAVSMLNAFNSPVTTFGDYTDVDEEVDPGPLPGLG